MNKKPYSGILILFLFAFIFSNVSFALNLSNIRQMPEQVHEVWYAGVFKYMIDYNGDKIYNPDYSISLLNSSNISFVDPEKMSDDVEIQLLISNAKTKAKDTFSLKKTCNNYFYFRENNKMGISVKQSAFYGLGDDSLSSIYHNPLALYFLNEYFGLDVERNAEYDEEGNFIRYDYKLKTIGGPLEQIALSMIADYGFRIQLMALSNSVHVLRQPSMDIIQSYDSCYLFSSYLEDTLDKMYSASELSAKASNQRLSKLINDYNYIEFLGFCNPSYSLAGSKVCKEELALLEGIEVGSSVNFVKAKKAIESINYEAYSENTTYSKWQSSIEESWKFVSLVDEITATSEIDVTNAVYIFDSKKEAIGSELSLLAQRIKEGEQEEFGLMDGVYLKGSLIQQIENIKSKFNTMKYTYSESRQGVQKISELRMGYSKNWLADGLQYEDEILENLTDAISLSNQIKTDSIELVSNMKKSAVDLIKEAKKKGYGVEYEEELIAKGDAETKQGKKFYYYKEAFVSLIYAFSESNQSLYSDYNYYSTYLPNLLERATDDGINIDEEKSLLQTYLSTQNIKDAIIGMKNIEKRVIAKATLQFNGLEGYRLQIYDYISASQGYLDYLIPQLNQKETGIVINNKIDYKQGIGNLKNLNEFYLKVLLDIEKDIQKVGAQMIKLSTYSNFDTINTDSEMTLRSSLTVYNPTGIEVKNAVLSVYLPFEINDNDVGEAELISYKNCIAGLRFKSIDPFETKTINIEKTGIFAKKYDIVKEASAYLEKANVTEKFYIQSLACTKKIKLKEEYDGLKNANLISKNTIIGDFGQGYYEFQAFKTINHAYDVEKSEYSYTAHTQGTLVSYKLVVKKKIELDYILHPLESNVSVSGATTSRYSLNKNILKIESPDDVEVFYVAYLVKDILSDINNKINKIKKNPLTVAEQNKLDSINDSIAIQDYQTALETVNLLEQEVAKRIKREDGLKSTRDYLDNEITKELISIEEAENYSKSHLIELPEAYIKKKVELAALLQMVESNESDKIESAGKAYEKKGLEKINEALASEYFKRFAVAQKEYSSISVEDPLFDSLSKNFTLLFEKHKSDKESSKHCIMLLDALIKIEERASMLKGSKDELLLAQSNRIKEKIAEIESLFENYQKIYEYAVVLAKISPAPSEIRKKIDKEVSLFEKTPSEKIIAELEKIEKEMTSSVEGIYELAYLEIEKASIILRSGTFDDKTKAMIEIGLEDTEKLLQKRELEKALPVLKNTLALLKKGEEFKKGEFQFDKNLIIAGVLIFAICALYFNETRKKGEKKEIKMLKRSDDAEPK